MSEVVMKGKVIKKPVLKYTKDAILCCRFVFEKEEEDGFFSVLAFENLCSPLLELKVGSNVCIQGNLKSFCFYDADDTCLYGCFIALNKIEFNKKTYSENFPEKHNKYIKLLKEDNILPVTEDDYAVLNEYCKEAELNW